MLNNISPRERVMVFSVALVAVISFLWLGVYDPLVEGRVTLKRKIDVKKKELVEVSILSKRVREEKKRYERLRKKLNALPRGLSAIAAMESLATEAGIRGKIVSMSPQPSVNIEGYKESLINIQIRNVSLQEIKLFLESKQESQNVFRIKRISMKPKFDDPSLMDISMSVASYEAIR
ncbi:hypothetical protein MNBD_NITROSPINAE02-1577 [hydrothermal vent metagenome]|uniref:General secretion pathway protein M n=1 Tax=hydrothermal vent metagenome TaxID=652676 RepID=A0A3B1BFX8_9ZZZZ